MAKKKENKCIICTDNSNKSSETIILKEWIIDGKNDAKLGKDLPVHSKCLSNNLYIERPAGFVYGKVAIGKDKKQKDSKE